METLKCVEDEELSREAFKLIEKVKLECDKETRDSVKTRCRQLYGYLFMSGILSTVSYVYASAKGENNVKKAFEWLKGRGPIPKNGREDISYAIYAASMCRMFELAGIDVKGASLGVIIETLTQNTDHTLIAEELALRFAKWLKRYSEALL